MQIIIAGHGDCQEIENDQVMMENHLEVLDNQLQRLKRAELMRFNDCSDSVFWRN